MLLQMRLKPSPKRCGTSPKQVLPVAAFFGETESLVIALHWSVDSGFLCRVKLTSSGDAELFIARRIFPSLPSFSDEFTCAVPMTRIRDIAHRGDIPHDMKQCLGTFKSFICDCHNLKCLGPRGWKI